MRRKEFLSSLLRFYNPLLFKIVNNFKLLSQLKNNDLKMRCFINIFLCRHKCNILLRYSWYNSFHLKVNISIFMPYTLGLYTPPLMISGCTLVHMIHMHYHDVVPGGSQLHLWGLGSHGNQSKDKIYSRHVAVVLVLRSLYLLFLSFVNNSTNVISKLQWCS